MKIGIVTLHNASNHGAFLQAFALKIYFAKLGHEVFFVKHNARLPFLRLFCRIFLRILHGKVCQIPFMLKQYFGMKKARKNLKKISIRHINTLGLIIFGSDEIWNVKNLRNQKHPILFGKGIDHNNKVSYAPSINMSSIKDFYGKHQLVDALREMKQISVRDEHSQSVIAELTGKKVSVVLDPTLLIPKELYCKYMSPIEMCKPFALVYSYKTKAENNDIILKLVKYAHEQNLVLVSVMEYLDWCDYNISATPFEVLAYFDKANFVIADTFHGTVFSLIFEKGFVVPSVNSNKLNDLLKKFCVEDRVIKNCSDIKKIIETKIDYELINQIKCKKIDESKEYINNVLKL